MARGFTLLTVLLLAGVTGFGQIYFPGGGGVGFPGQGGVGFPGRRRNNPNNPNNPNNRPNTTLPGLLRTIGDTTVVIESDDHVYTTVSISNSTKYIGESGGNAHIGDFQPGDHVSIDANQDNNSNYRAVTVTMIRVGTADEHSTASQPIDRSKSASGNSSRNNTSSNTSIGDDDDRPKLRRAASSSDSSSSDSSASSTTTTSRNTSSNNSPPPTITPRDPDDSGPPVLRRGRPASTDSSDSTSSNSSNSSTSSQQVASARPSIHADDVNGVTRTPPPPVVGAPTEGDNGGPRFSRLQGTGDPFIDDTREAAFSFNETLPNYVVKQYTTRYATGAASGGHTSWQALDTVTADVIMEDGTEKYKNIQVNGRAARDSDPEKSGSWSRGEFSSLQLDILSPLTHADFRAKRATTIVNRSAFKYDFSVEQPNSHWHVEAEGQSYLPAYTGTIWIDKENHRVLRIELSAQNMPRTFPIDQVESAVDYDYVFIGEGKYLLPVHSEALSCERGSSRCSRNVIEFRNYKKFTADTSITFDSDSH